jgi:hypothetical protein
MGSTATTGKKIMKRSSATTITGSIILDMGLPLASTEIFGHNEGLHSIEPYNVLLPCEFFPVVSFVDAFNTQSEMTTLPMPLINALSHHYRTGVGQ